MDSRVTAARVGTALSVSLSSLRPGTTATIVRVGSATALDPIDTRLLELGFISGETVEVMTEARPGGDPFVVRVGSTTFALRRLEARNVWVEDAHGAQ